MMMMMTMCRSEGFFYDLVFIDKEKEELTHRQTDTHRQIDTQTHTQTDTQTDRQTDRQTDLTGRLITMNIRKWRNKKKTQDK